MLLRSEDYDLCNNMLVVSAQIEKVLGNFRNTQPYCNVGRGPFQTTS